jgi:hypothetical protein
MKNVLLSLGILLAASPAFATRARLESLGDSKFGSYFINDDRNIFLNPAQLVNHKNKLIVELGADPGTAVDRSVLANRPQGGFISTIGSNTFGLYLNQTSDRALDFISQANGFITLSGALGGPTSTSFIGPDSAVEAFFAGEGDLGWGFSVFYAGNNDRTAGLERTSSLLGARLGIISGNLQVFSSVGLNSSARVRNATNDELKGKISLDVASTYKIDDLTVFGKFMTYGAEVRNAAVIGANRTAEVENLGFGLGVGKQHEISKTVTMFSRIQADYFKTDVSNAPALLASRLPSVTYWNIPLVLAAEAQAVEWLAIRGAIAQSLAGQQMGARGVANGQLSGNSLAGTTTVTVGVGVTLGDFTIDGIVATNGTQPAVTGHNTIPGFGTAPQSNTNFGFGDTMLSRLAMTYKF